MSIKGAKIVGRIECRHIYLLYLRHLALVGIEQVEIINRSTVNLPSPPFSLQINLLSLAISRDLHFCACIQRGLTSASSVQTCHQGIMQIMVVELQKC